MLRTIACFIGCTGLAPLSAQVPAPTPFFPTARVALVTNLGRIVFELEKGRAPITTGNLLRYVDGRRLDDVTFYRTRRAP